MTARAKNRQQPWQPFTFGGVASFAHASFGHFALVVSASALIGGASIAFFFLHAWAPALDRAISQLPDQGEIRAGRLEWVGATPHCLVSGAFLSMIVDPDSIGGFGDVADVQCELNLTGIRVRSLLGYLTVPYPSNWRIALNRPEVEPWWGAWKPVIAATLIAGTVLWLWTVWSLLGLVYALPVSLLAFYADRRARFRNCWQLAVVSCLPGATVMSLGIVAYAFYQIQLVQLLIVTAVHFAVAWIYVFIAPFWLPRLGQTDRVFGAKNPFREPRAK